MSRTKAAEATMECIVTPITKRLVRPDQDPIVYVAGPMRGIPEFNFPAFDQARDYVVGLDKYQVISPADVDREEKLELPDVNDVPANIFELCMRRDLEIVANAHAILLLKGWEASKGANNELFVANACGVEVWLANYDDSGDVIDHSVSYETVVPPLIYGQRYDDGDTVWVFDGALGSFVPEGSNQVSIQTGDEAEQTILEEANHLIYGPRQESYGHPAEDMGRTGRMWGAILGIDDVSAEKVALCMVAVKMSREVNRPKRDNRVDMAGYAGCVDRIQTYNEELQSS